MQQTHDKMACAVGHKTELLTQAISRSGKRCERQLVGTANTISCLFYRQPTNIYKKGDRTHTHTPLEQEWH